jgi:hypothetical protein
MSTEHWWNDSSQSKTEVLGEKLAKGPLSPLQIPHGPWDWTQKLAPNGLSSGATFWPYSSSLFYIVQVPGYEMEFYWSKMYFTYITMFTDYVTNFFRFLLKILCYKATMTWVKRLRGLPIFHLSADSNSILIILSILAFSAHVLSTTVCVHVFSL